METKITDNKNQASTNEAPDFEIIDVQGCMNSWGGGGGGTSVTGGS